MGLRRRGIDTDFGFMADCSKIGEDAASGDPCPNAERTAREIVHLPIYPFLKKGQIDRIASAVRETLQDLS